MEEPALRVVGGLLEELPGVEGNLLCRGGLAEDEEEELAVGGEGVEADWFGCRGWGEVPVHPALVAVGAVDARSLWRGLIEEGWVMDGEVLAWVAWVERPRGAEAGGGGGVCGGGGSCCRSCGCGGRSGGGGCSGGGIGSGCCGGGGSGAGWRGCAGPGNGWGRVGGGGVEDGVGMGDQPGFEGRSGGCGFVGEGCLLSAPGPGD